MASPNVLIDFTKWIFKWVGIFIAGGLLIGLLVAGAGWGWTWLSHDRHAANIRIVVFSPKPKTGEKGVCTDDKFPVFVGFVNGSSRTVEYVSIVVNAHLLGHSSDILDYSHVTADDVVAPGAGFGRCY
jgi:hypothetical protein